jgi:nitrate reductase gamma subunit
MNLTSILAIAFWSALGIVLWLEVLEDLENNKLHIKKAILFTILCGPFAIIAFIILLIQRAMKKLDLTKRCTKWLIKENRIHYADRI